MAEKKLHWTQRPENRHKVIAMAKKATRTNRKRRLADARPKPLTPKPLTRRKPTNAETEQRAEERFTREDVAVAHAHGRVTEIIAAVARQAGVPESVLAGGVGKLLQGR